MGNKFLQVEGEVEKALVAVFDAALKSGGWSLIQAIDLVRNAIKVMENPNPPQPPASQG